MSKQMKFKIRQAYIRGMIDLSLFLLGSTLVGSYMYMFLEKLFS